MIVAKIPMAGALLLALLLLTGFGADQPALITGSQQTGSPPAVTGPPPCHFVDWLPYHDIQTVCVELVYDHITAPEAAPALTGLAFAPDGTLYLVRTALGEIWAMHDRDGDQFMDDAHSVAQGLTLPTGIAVYHDALYVVSMEGVLRLNDSNSDGQFDTQTLLIADLPTDTGFWPGSVGIGPDERLYISLGVGCDTCAETEARRGVILSYTLDGQDEQLVAEGLRQPADFAWHPITGELWVVDSARPLSSTALTGPPDELNRVVLGTHYGYPWCYGTHVPYPAWNDQVQVCVDTAPPQFEFPYQSSPAGIAFYPDETGDRNLFGTGDLLVALRGSWHLPEPAGYALALIRFDGADPQHILEYVAPSDLSRYYRHDPVSVFSLAGRGFFPYRPSDVAVSVEGWVYVSLEEGRILRFRPLVRTSITSE